MNKNAFIWIYDNIERYEFIGYEANKLKLSIESFNMETDNDFLDLYNEFCNKFNNDVCVYTNGLYIKGIVSGELDCYFIETSDGPVPIGYYKEIRPAETVILTAKILDESSTDYNKNKHNIISGMEKTVFDMNNAYKSVSESGNPDIIRFFWGFVCSATSFLMSLVLLVVLNPFYVFLNRGYESYIKQYIELIPVSGENAYTVYSLFVVMCIAQLIFSVISVILSIKEYKLCSEMTNTKKILDSIHEPIEKIKQADNKVELSNMDSLCVAARRGENFSIDKTDYSQISEFTKKELYIAAVFFAKTDRERTGISRGLICLNCILFLFAFVLFIFM